MRFNISKRTASRSYHEEGVWVSLDDDRYEQKLIIADPGDGPAIRVASSESRAYKKGYDRVIKQNGDLIRALSYVPLDVREAAENEGLLGAITDWRMPDEFGQQVPLSEERLREILRDEPSFRQRALQVAGDLSKYDQAAVEADTQNLSNGSATPSNGKLTAAAERAGAMSSH